MSAGVVDTFPDPAVIRGKDGAWYAYGTQNPIFNSIGEQGEHILPILRSEDLADWTYVGDVIPGATPATWQSSSRAWAPDIRYVNGEYLLTYGLSTGGLALAMAPTPTGPWTHHDELIVPSAPVEGCPTGNIDQSLFTDDDGTLYLYWGSYDLICVSELSADGTELIGPVTQVAQGRRMEGGYVVRHGEYYYLMYSDAGCCEGESSGYTVKVGRGDNPRGPFVDDRGIDLMAESSKGGIVLASNGNRFTGPGHHSVVTDLAGQDWMVYHAIPRDDADFPPFTGPGGGTLRLSKRPLMIDRLDWINGWPVVNAGAGPSEGPRPAPVTSGFVTTTFADASLDHWVPDGDVSLANDLDTGRHIRLDDATLTSRANGTGDLRAQADLRLVDTDSAAGLAIGVARRSRAAAWIDRAAGELRVEVTKDRRTETVAAPLPDEFRYDTWHVMTLDWRRGVLTAAVSADNILEPLATVSVDAPPGARASGPVAVFADGVADADNISLVRLASPVTERVDEPAPDRLLADFSDEFDGALEPGTEGSAWSWVRGPAPGARVEDGAFVFPTQAAELYLAGNTASVLLRDAPDGDYMVETRLRFDGTRVNQQAGLILYENDDRFVKLVHSHLGLARRPGSVADQVEFTREGPRPTTTPPTAVYASPMWGAAPAETTWFRLYVREDVANAEYEVRMASSTDGEKWDWGGVWTLPRRADLRIGVISMNTAGATAQFDYVRTYAVDRPNRAP
ncbi:family 43 glycosylhydrolase [Jiangella aurantiaca]|uniref:family 43 glycosylhydrolase n=1 Tax=Jiangella aurantiaca TaxID=2530373 RepID=UPI00193E4A57|nr:family 43 glycosylhydrolase [Jiangella aurantiaca]